MPVYDILQSLADLSAQAVDLLNSVLRLLSFVTTAGLMLVLICIVNGFQRQLFITVFVVLHDLVYWFFYCLLEVKFLRSYFLCPA
jgi:hypothetical protein